MRRSLGLMAAVLGLSTAASAGTLTVYSTDLANNPTNHFFVGDTIQIKVTGDGQGNVFENSLIGELHWNGSIVDTVSGTQGVWLQDLGGMFLAEGSGLAFNQTGVLLNSGTATSVITLTAVAVGVSTQTWGGTLLDFFGIYSYTSGSVNLPTGHSFTITPEPATAELIALGLLGPALAARAGRIQKRTSRSSD